MTADEIVKLVKETREAQKAYFKSRSQADLEKSKRLERLLDKEISLYLDPQPRLFG